jgi:hypothetical protein
MARLISKATNSFTTATTWGLVDDTSYLDSENSNTALTSSFAHSSTFTPGAITVDGITVKLALRGGSTGTITVDLTLDAGNVSQKSVTIDIADLASTGGTGAYVHGWYFFKFDSSFLLTAATAYKISAKISGGASAVNLYRDATTSNWSRMLRTTTTQAPAAGDQLHVIGEHTGQGTGNSFTVTMDNTGGASYGPTVSGGPPQGVTIGKRGTLTFDPGTNTVFKWKGILMVCDGGTLNVGTSGTPIPDTSGAELIMDSVANVDTGLHINEGGTLNVYGYPKFTTTFKTLLNTDEAASQTVLGVASTTGWLDGDEICIASTTQTYSQCELRSISTVDSGTQVTVSAGLTYAHSGTSPTQAEVGNLTRNVKIHGIGTNAPSTTTTLQGYLFFAATSVTTLRYCRFYYLGSATTGKRGFDVAATTGSFDMQYCSIMNGWITSSRGINVTAVTGTGIIFSNNVVFNVHDRHFINVATTSGYATVSGNLFMLNIIASNGMVELVSYSVVFTNNTMCGAALICFQAINATGEKLTQDWSGNTFHSSLLSANLTWIRGGTISNWTWWRCSADGLRLSNVGFLTFVGGVGFGNSTSNMSILGTVFEVVIDALVSNGDSTFTTGKGFATYGTNAGMGGSVLLLNCDFSTVTGIKTAHTNGDIALSASFPDTCRIRAHNCKLGATTEIYGQSTMATDSFISSQKHDQTNGSHKCWMRGGTVSIDTTLSHSASPSSRMTPINASDKLLSGPPGYGFQKTVNSGQTCAASVWVRKSAVSQGDAATYNGNQPRLIVRKNVAAGISADTVLDTATAASDGAWEQLTGTTAAVTDDCVLQFIVDCDGTEGWINVDDFA